MTQCWRVGDYVILNGPSSSYKGVRTRIVAAYSEALWYVEIEGKRRLFNCYHFDYDKKSNIKAFYEQVLLLDGGEGK